MNKYSSLIAELEISSESFNALCKKHGFVPATAYNAIGRVRPDLLGPRSERLGFARIQPKGDQATAAQRAEAVRRVLAGEAVKDVAADLGIPAPTLYRYVSSAKTRSGTFGKTEPKNHLDALKAAVHHALAAGEGRESVIQAVLSAMNQPA